MKGVDVSDSEQDDQVIKRQSAGGEDKYPQDKVPEQRADGMCRLIKFHCVYIYTTYVNNKVGKYIMNMMM